MGKLISAECPRCKKGDVAIDRDQYGWYEYCLQCGYMRDLIDVAASGQHEAGDVRGHRQRVGSSGGGK